VSLGSFQSFHPQRAAADVKDLRITKYVDAASPILLQEAFKGSDQKTAQLTVIKVGGKAGPIEFVKIAMEGTVFISSVMTGDTLPNDRYSETVTLNFSKATFTYTIQKADQTAGASIPGVLEIAKQY
jgi:type VI secretion system secreted protein Hcp